MLCPVPSWLKDGSGKAQLTNLDDALFASFKGCQLVGFCQVSSLKAGHSTPSRRSAQRVPRADWLRGVKLALTHHARLNGHLSCASYPAEERGVEPWADKTRRSGRGGGAQSGQNRR